MSATSAFALPSPDTPFGERVARRLSADPVIWLTTTGDDFTPQPTPVWFLWDGASFLIYSLPDAARLRHIAHNPRVALHLDGNGQGGDIVVFTGTARVAPEEPPADRNAAYIAKYQARVDASFGGPAPFAQRYSTPVRVTPLRLRGR